jgi:hypothetical protein
MCCIRAYGLAAMDVATILAVAVGPDDIIGERGQHPVHVPGVKAIVHVFEDFDVIVHRASPCMARVLRSIHMHVCIWTSVSARRRCDGPGCAYRRLGT